MRAIVIVSLVLLALAYPASAAYPVWVYPSAYYGPAYPINETHYMVTVHDRATDIYYAAILSFNTTTYTLTGVGYYKEYSDAGGYGGSGSATLLGIYTPPGYSPNPYQGYRAGSLLPLGYGDGYFVAKISTYGWGAVYGLFRENGTAIYEITVWDWSFTPDAAFIDADADRVILISTYWPSLAYVWPSSTRYIAALTLNGEFVWGLETPGLTSWPYHNPGHAYDPEHNLLFLLDNENVYVINITTGNIIKTINYEGVDTWVRAWPYPTRQFGHPSEGTNLFVYGDLVLLTFVTEVPAGYSHSYNLTILAINTETMSATFYTYPITIPADEPVKYGTLTINGETVIPMATRPDYSNVSAQFILPVLEDMRVVVYCEGSGDSVIDPIVTTAGEGGNYLVVHELHAVYCNEYAPTSIDPAPEGFDRTYPYVPQLLVNPVEYDLVEKHVEVQVGIVALFSVSDPVTVTVQGRELVISGVDKVVTIKAPTPADPPLYVSDGVLIINTPRFALIPVGSTPYWNATTDGEAWYYGFYPPANIVLYPYVNVTYTFETGEQPDSGDTTGVFMLSQMPLSDFAVKVMAQTALQAPAGEPIVIYNATTLIVYPTVNLVPAPGSSYELGGDAATTVPVLILWLSWLALLALIRALRR